MIKKKSPEVITIYEGHIYELRGEELYERRLSQISRYIYIYIYIFFFFFFFFKRARTNSCV